MPIIKNNDHYICDVAGCKKEAFIKQDSPKNDWAERSYTDAEGRTIPLCLCAGHALQFDAIKQVHAQEYFDFVNHDQLPNSIKGE